MGAGLRDPTRRSVTRDRPAGATATPCAPGAPWPWSPLPSDPRWPPPACPVGVAGGDGSSSDTSAPPTTPASPRAAAVQVWSTLSPLLAGRPRVRESRNGGHAYLRRWERPLTSWLPAVPAAVPIYSAAGDTRF